MIRDAVKFTDVDTFLAVMRRMGHNGTVTSLLYEEDKLPYCSAYFIPTDLLLEVFDLEVIGEFGGVITQVEDIRYLGIERFTVDFMVFPVSLTGYVEIETYEPVNFASEKTYNDGLEMQYVINLVDGGGQEFYLSATNKMVRLSSEEQQDPLLLKTNKQVTKQVELLREKYPATCQIYALERRDFESRLKAPQPPHQD